MKQQPTEPIIYAATPSADVARYFPQNMSRECVKLACGLCKASLMAARSTYTNAISAAKRMGRPVLVLCPKCFEKETRDTDELLVMYQHDAKVQSVIDKHEAERN